MTTISERLKAFIGERVGYLEGLKTINEQQQMFVELGRKFLSGSEMTPTETRALRTLADAEKAAERAAEKIRAARKLVSEENEKARKERTRNMINSAGLMGLAGLLDKKTGKPLTSPALLLGALVELANRNPTDLEKQGWEQTGAAMLAKAKADKNG